MMKMKNRYLVLLYLPLLIFAFFYPLLAFALLSFYTLYIIISFTKDDTVKQLQRHHLRDLVEKNNDLLESQKIENQQYLELLTNSIGTPLFFVTPENKITLYNKQFLELFPERNVSISLQKFINSTLLLETADVTTLKIRKQYYKIISTPMKADDQLYRGSIFILTDITDDKQLQISQQTFISHASHEIKTPLTVIKGAAEILEQQKNNPESVEFSQMILDEVKQMERLIEQLLELTKLKSPTYVLNSKTFSLIGTLEATISRLKQRAKSKNVRFSFTFDTEIDYFGDELKLDQVFLNLLSNALAHCFEHTTIDVTLLKKEKYVLLQIKNIGKPIPKSDRQKIFLPFYRLTSDNEGTGLGLAISKEIIELHGGKIALKTSTTDNTVIFEVFLPF